MATNSQVAAQAPAVPEPISAPAPAGPEPVNTAGGELASHPINNKSNGSTPAAAKVPVATGSTYMKNVLTLLGTMLADSGAGFGVGTFLAKGNMTGISLLVFVASLLFAFEMVIRYAAGSAVSGPMTWGFAGTLVLTGAALIPYLSMAKGSKDRSKVVAAAGPTMVVAWTGAALLFTYLVARGSAVAGALQGAIISIMYLSVSAVGGYNVAVKSRGMALFAAFVWSLLALFDFSGLARNSASNV